MAQVPTRDERRVIFKFRPEMKKVMIQCRFIRTGSVSIGPGSLWQIA